MVQDPLATQRDVVPAAELGAAGFEDAHEVGRGGFGVVYRCVQCDLDRTVAVKVLVGAVDEENRTRFFREQRAMGRLTGHPNIVNVFQVGTTGSNRPYIVMQYHPHDSLEAWIRRKGPMGLGAALSLGVKIAGALEVAHQVGIIHRDVKPGNILFTDYGEPALTDFGIAHIVGGFKTATSIVTGSPAFTAPEILGGEPPSVASDIYSLGATLFCAVTGHAAFERRSGEQVIAQFLRITSEPVPNLQDLGLNEDVAAVISHAMATDPHERPGTAAQLGEELRAAQRSNGLVVDKMARHAEPYAEPHVPAPVPAPGSGGPRRPKGDGRRTPLKGNLPPEMSSFVGRRTELGEAKGLLGKSRLVTLTGIGGVGKTRLAVRAAAETRKAHPDGIWFVGLAELHDPSLLANVMSAALGLRDRSARPAQEVVVEFLSSRRLLLVIDNCEQVIDAVAALTGTLLRSCPETRILITSREPLMVEGEAVLRVPPLSVPDPDHTPTLKGLPRYDAVTLFAERAAAVVPSFELTENNRFAITRICNRLDGLPLAIELAAARLQALSAEQILQRLTDRYTLLNRSHRGTPTRQQTLQLCIDWSHELCTPQEQQVWRQLSVFAGSFELDAAQDICTDLTGEELFDVVASLVDKSILIREDAGTVVRFRILETLLGYGRTKLRETGEYETLRRRHRDWYTQLAAQAEAEWISPQQLAWIDRLEREQPNFRQVLQLSLTEPGIPTTTHPQDAGGDPSPGLCVAAALAEFWSLRGHREGRSWLDLTLAATDDAANRPTLARLKALGAAAYLAGVQGDRPAETARVEQMHELAARRGDAFSHALALTESARLAMFGGDPARCIETGQQALPALRSDADRSGIHLLALLDLLVDQASCYATLGNFDHATALIEEIFALTEPRGEIIYRASGFRVLAWASWRRGDLRNTIKLAEQSLRLDRIVNDHHFAPQSLQMLAWACADESQYEKVAILLGADAALRQAAGSVLLPEALDYQEKCTGITRRALGERAFTKAFRHGSRLTFDDIVAYVLDEQLTTPKPANIATSLTRREQQVAGLIARGMTNKAIADDLVISPRTVHGHVEHILAKLGFTNRAQIAAYITEHAQNH